MYSHTKHEFSGLDSFAVTGKCFYVKFWRDRWTDSRNRQTDAGKTIPRNLLMQGHKNTTPNEECFVIHCRKRRKYYLPPLPPLLKKFLALNPFK